MSVQAPSTDGLEDLDALIEEARRRARQRRLGYLAVAAATALAAGVGYLIFGGGGDEGASGGSPASEPAATGPGGRLYLAAYRPYGRTLAITVHGRTHHSRISKGAVVVVNPARGTKRLVKLPKLSPVDVPLSIFPVGHRLVFTGHGAVYSIDRSLRPPARKLGKGLWFAPSADGRRVWLLQGHNVREVTLAGRKTSPPIKLPGPVAFEGTVPQGLVLSGERKLRVWDPSTQKSVLSLPYGAADAVRGDLLAWCEARANVLHLRNVASGTDQTVRLAIAGQRLGCEGPAAFSPDGTTLGILGYPLGQGDARSHLVLVDANSGSVQGVAGSGVSGYTYVAWAPDSQSVFITGGNTEHRRILEYTLGEPRAKPIPVQVNDFYGMAAVG